MNPSQEYKIQKNMLFDKIAILADQFELAKNPSHVKRRLESLLVEWMDSAVVRGLTSDKPLLDGISSHGMITSLTDLIESSEERIDARHRELMTQLERNITSIGSVTIYQSTVHDQESFKILGELLAEQDAIILQSKGLGLTLIDRKVEFNDISAQLIHDIFSENDHPLAPFADVDTVNSVLYIPSAYLEQAISSLQNEYATVIAISAVPPSIPGLKNEIDLDRKLELRSKVGSFEP